MPRSRSRRRSGFAYQGGQQGVAAQGIVVVEVLVAQGQAVDALGHELGDGVFEGVGVPVVGKARGELAEGAGEAFGLAQQEATAVGGDRTAIEAAEDFAGPQGLKNQGGGVTLCGHEAVSPSWHRGCWLQSLCQREQPLSIPLVRNAG